VSTRSLTRLAAATLGAASLVLITGCGGSSKPAPSTPPTTPPTTPAAAPTTSAAPSTPDPTAQAKSDALAAYQKVIAITTKEFATNQEQPDLLTYATGTAFVFFRKALNYQVSNDIVYTGTPQSSPTVTGLKMDTTPPSATIADCYGGPNYKPVFVKDVDGHKKGDSAIVAGSSMAPHPVTAVLEDKNGAWQVINYTTAPQTC